MRIFCDGSTIYRSKYQVFLHGRYHYMLAQDTRRRVTTLADNCQNIMEHKEYKAIIIAMESNRVVFLSRLPIMRRPIVRSVVCAMRGGIVLLLVSLCQGCLFSESVATLPAAEVSATEATASPFAVAKDGMKKSGEHLTTMDTGGAHLYPAATDIAALSPATRCVAEDCSPAMQTPLPVYHHERYTVSVDDVPVRELLYALARDANINIDIATEVTATVSMNAVNQSLLMILDRLIKPAAIRYHFLHDTLVIQADLPYFKHYDIAYLNLARNAQETVSITTQMTSAGATESGVDNLSATAIESSYSHDVWKHLHAAIATLLGFAADSAELKKHLAINQAAGLLSVMANSVQHVQIAELIHNTLENLKRQVLIQVTVIEVELNEGYQSGIDWSLIDLGGAGFSIASDLYGGGVLSAAGNDKRAFALQYQDADLAGKNLQAVIELFSDFGKTRVLSSPQIRVLNNHTAVLKVVENFVYFEVEQKINSGSTLNGTTALLATTTTPKTIPVGLVMTVTPQISDDLSVILSVRPTISSVIRTVVDPNPNLSRIQNRIPVVRVREMESILKLNSREIGVLGGLMQDSYQQSEKGIPWLSRIPLLRNAFTATRQSVRKTELVIFMRPVVLPRQTV